MALPTHPPLQRSGELGRRDARLFRIRWALIEAVCIPALAMLAVVLLAVLPSQRGNTGTPTQSQR